MLDKYLVFHHFKIQMAATLFNKNKAQQKIGNNVLKKSVDALSPCIKSCKWLVFFHSLKLDSLSMFMGMMADLCLTPR